MRMLSIVVGLVMTLSVHAPRAHAGDHESGIDWQPYGKGAFERAAKEKKLVLLSLEAVWCHWCHVMARETYSNPRVRERLAKSYIAIKVDQDSRPDLANRYKEYGWPATIVLAPDGKDLVKLAGFIPPDEFLESLDKAEKGGDTFDERSPAPMVPAPGGSLSESIRAALVTRHEKSLDPVVGGLKLKQRYLEPESLEFASLRGSAGNETDRAWMEKTLVGGLKLIDPAWGGIYQYSTHGDWDHPHFEKIMPSQMRGMVAYGRAGESLSRPDFTAAGTRIADYLDTFLSAPDGSFYVSQDADLEPGSHSEKYFALDDQARRAQGTPRVDKHVYARENGLAIQGVAFLGAVKNDQKLLDRAAAGEHAVAAALKSKAGVYERSGPPVLADSLSMAEAEAMLYRTRGDRSALESAKVTFQSIIETFGDHESGGFWSSAQVPGEPLSPVKLVDENVRAARLGNLLWHYLGIKEFRDAAESGLRYLGTESVAFDSLTEPGILLSDFELRNDPMHVTIAGPRSDKTAVELFATARRYPYSYLRLDWYDPATEKPPNPDVQYPKLPFIAAFVCTNKRCSLPLRTPDDLKKAIGEAHVRLYKNL